MTAATRITTAAIGLAAFTLIAGCATSEVQRERVVASLRQSEATLARQASSEGFAGAKVNSGLLNNGLESYRLGPGASVTEMAGGKAYYLVFELPEFSEPYFVELAPQTQRIGTNPISGTATETTNWPAVTLLDQDLRPIQSYMPRYTPDPFRYFWQVGEQFGFVSICNSNAKFVAVHGVPPAYGSSSRKMNDMFMIVGSMYATTAQALTTVQHPQGEVHVGITGRAPSNMARKIEGATACTREPLTLSAFLKQLAQDRSE